MPHFYLWLALSLLWLGCQAAPSKDSLPSPGDTVSSKTSASIKATKTQNQQPVLQQLTYAQALQLAWNKNPQLQTFISNIRAKEGARLQAGLWPNPELEVELENFAGRDQRNDLQAAEVNIRVEQLVKLGGKIAKQQKFAHLDKQKAKWQYQVQRWKLAKQVKMAFFEALFLQEKAALSQDLLELAQEVAQSVALRVEAGKVSPIEKTKAQITLADAEIAQQRAHKKWHNAKRKLAALWGDSQIEFEQITGNLQKRYELPSLTKLYHHIQENPELVALHKKLHLRRSEVEMAQAKAIPDIKVGLGWRFFNEDDDHAWVASVALPLPIFDRNQGNIQKAQWQTTETAQEITAKDLNLRNQVTVLYHALVSLSQEITSLENNVLQNSQEVFQAVKEGYQRGKFDYLQVLDSQRTLFEGKRKFLETLADYHNHLIRLEALLATDLQPLAQGDSDEQN